MDKESVLLEIFSNDPFGILEIKEKAVAINADDRLVASFEEINAFVDAHGREPQRAMDDMQERKLYSRLKGIRENPEKTAALKQHDRHGLLRGEEKPEIGSLEDILNDDVLGLLDDDAEDIFTLKHVPKETTMPEYVARRKVCRNFERYRPLFEACQKDLREGRRELFPFKDEQQIHPGYFFLLHGVLLYVDRVGKRERIKGKTNARLHCIFENGTESDMLLRSLAAELYKDGRRVSEYEDRLAAQFYTVTDDDTGTGYIYILRSLSSDPRIQAFDHLHKIGYATVAVQERIKDAAKEPTYLMAPVEIVAEYQAYNLNPQKFEHLLHTFFGEACLNIDVFDIDGQRHTPREWFDVPLPVIDEAIRYILSGEIVDYRYDHERQIIIGREEIKR